MRNAAGWLPKIWGWDRPGSNSLIVFPLEEQIKRLQVQFQNGGHEKNRFNPAEIIQAHIARRDGGSIQNALCYYTPETGWQQGTKPYQSPDKPVDLPEMSGKLWVTGPNMKAEKIRDLAVNSGATDAERNAAKSFLRKSTTDKTPEPVPTVAPPPSTKVEQWVQQQAAAQHQQRKIALAVQRRINEEMRRKMYGRAVNVPHSVEKGPDYSGFILVILVVAFLIGYGC